MGVLRLVMSELLQQIIQAQRDYSPDILNPDYQANMFLIERAMQQLGHSEPPDFQPSQYDDALMKLIDSVPME